MSLSSLSLREFSHSSELRDFFGSSEDSRLRDAAIYGVRHIPEVHTLRSSLLILMRSSLLLMSSSFLLIIGILISSVTGSLTWRWASVDVTWIKLSKFDSCWHRLLCKDHLRLVFFHVHQREAILGPRDSWIRFPGIIIVVIACWGVAARTSRRVVVFLLFTNLNLVHDNCLSWHQWHHAGLKGCLPIENLYAVELAFKVVSALPVHLEKVIKVFTSTH